jgi:hypothetical protein
MLDHSQARLEGPNHLFIRFRALSNNKAASLPFTFLLAGL